MKTKAPNQAQQEVLQTVRVEPPTPPERGRREARFAKTGEKRSRYSLPVSLDTSSPVGYRCRMPFSEAETEQILPLLSLSPPTQFAPPEPLTESDLFEESSLGILSSRQATNFRGLRQFCFGPDDSQRVAELLRQINGNHSPVLDSAAYTQVVVAKPYRTKFTLLLSLIGHRALLSLLTVPRRVLQKWARFNDDIPSVGFLPDLHIGILADNLERAVVIASRGRRRAQIHMTPFLERSPHRQKQQALRELESMCGFVRRDRRQGWRIAFVAQVGQAIASERVELSAGLARKLGANMLAFRSERIQPGVNQDHSAPPVYQQRQEMDVPEELTVMAGRAAYNAFSRWTACSRARAKELLLLERIDVLTANGKTRLRQIRKQLNDITDKIIRRLPRWADWPSGRAFSRSTNRGRKAFALAGQRIYLAGLSKTEVEKSAIPWRLALRALGAAASRSALYCEIMGCVNLPADCDLLAGTCIMSGPIHQNDIGKTFYGYQDLLSDAFAGRQATSVLLWSLKAKTVSDPIGNEEQLLNGRRQGPLVDLRAGPHEVIITVNQGQYRFMRKQAGRQNAERAFGDQGNFVTDPEGRQIPGNQGSRWPEKWRKQPVW